MSKVAFITGSTSGIGLGIAEHLASKNINIALTGFGDKNNINTIITNIEAKYKIKAAYFEGDIAIPSEIETMISNIKKKFDKVDILVNNAGIQHVSPIETFPNDKWESIIRIDLISAFYTTKLLIPEMKKNSWGRIINIASAHALVASPFKSAYVAAKHGILGLTKTVALEVAEYGITVNAICPGYVKTPLVLNQIADTAKARNMTEKDVINNVILGAQATKKFVEISEIAHFVEFLCSNSAASITGAALPIDGGWTAH